MPSTYFHRSIRSDVVVNREEFETQLQEFLIKADSEEKKYSLRAIKKVEKDRKGNECITYSLFKRNGTESFFEKLVNWYYQEEQRANAREAIKAGFSVSIYQAGLFHNEIDSLKRLLPGEEELSKILADRQFNLGVPNNSLSVTDRMINKEKVSYINSSCSIRLSSDTQLHSATESIKAPAETSIVLENADVKIASNGKADMKNSTPDDFVGRDAVAVMNPLLVPRSVALHKSFHEEQKSKTNSFSLQSMFESFSPFANSNRHGGKLVFSRAAGTVAKLVVQEKQQKSRETTLICNKSLAAKEPSGNHCPAKARSIKAIEVRHMTNLDLQDLHPSVAVLMRNTDDYFSMTKECREWLQRRARKIAGGPRSIQHGTITIIRSGDNIAYLAPHAESDPSREKFRKHLAGIASVYKQVVDDAVENGRPIVLTPLFHYDDETIEQYLGAMLRPVYAHLKAGKEVRLEIRTTCRKTAAALEKYQRQYSTSPLTEEGKPVPQFRSRLHEADLASEGMIMMAPETLELAGKKSRKILSEAGARFSAGQNLERVQPRKRLAQDAWSRCYFFADNFSEALNKGKTQAARQGKSSNPAMVGGAAMQKITNEITACYRAAFMAARENDCRFLMVPSLENRFGAMLSEELAAVQLLGILRGLKAEFPDICITVLSKSPHIKANFALLECAD